MIADASAGSLALQLVDGGGARATVAPPVRISTTSQVALQQLCEEGMGVAALFYQDARPALERGALVRVLPGWRLPSAVVTMVTSSTPGEPVKVTVAMAALRKYFAGLAAVDRISERGIDDPSFTSEPVDAP